VNLPNKPKVRPWSQRFELGVELMRNIRPCLVLLGGTIMLFTAAGVSTGAGPALAQTTTNPSNLIRNSCFVDPSVVKGSRYANVPAGSTAIPSWSVGRNGVQVIGTYWEPSPGCPWSLFLGNTTNSAGTVSQAVSTTPGSMYLLHWYMGAWPNQKLQAMHVVWDGVVVAKQALQCPGTLPCWTPDQVYVTATSTSSIVEFADVQNPSGGAALGTVSLTAAPVVNGFAAWGLSGVYGAAERQMLLKLPSHAVVDVSGTPVCALLAARADQVQNGNGLQLVWAISPTAQYIHEDAAARQTAAAAALRYLSQLLTTSRSLYITALQAERVPVPKTGGLTNWWGLMVQAKSTTGASMKFSIATTSGETTMTWASVPGITSTSQSVAASALANLLFYTQAVAAA